MSTFLSLVWLMVGLVTPGMLALSVVRLQQRFRGKSMHETDAFRQQCRTEVIARWWLPGCLRYHAEYQRDDRFAVYCDGVCIGYIIGTLEDAIDWAMKNGYVRLGEQP